MGTIKSHAVRRSLLPDRTEVIKFHPLEQMLRPAVVTQAVTIFRLYYEFLSFVGKIQTF
jgi:hypothetical protein